MPLVFGLGAPMVAKVGTNIGAGQRKRALRSAWIGAAIAAALCETIGLFGMGMALYFASQGAGQMLWPLIANFTRLMIAAGGGWLMLRSGGSLTQVFIAQGAALAAFGLINAGAVAAGAWFGGAAWPWPRLVPLRGRP